MEKQDEEMNKFVIFQIQKTLELTSELGRVAKELIANPESSMLIGGIAMCLSNTLRELQSEPKKRADGAASGEGGKVNSAPKRRNKQQGLGDRRHVRRRSLHPYISTKIANSLDDGYTWRKYGQKEIQSANHPRSYYRCTHKHLRGCQATRQAQKSDQDDTIYHITYIGHHTCREEPKKPLNVIPEPRLICFGGPSQDQFIVPSLPLVLTNQNCDDQDVISGQSYARGSPTSLDLVSQPVASPDAQWPENPDETSRFVSSMLAADEFDWPNSEIFNWTN